MSVLHVNPLITDQLPYLHHSRIPFIKKIKTMSTLPRREIRKRAYAFAQEWQGETREQAEAKPFWEAFFTVFGMQRRRIASFEEPVKKLGGQQGFVDLLWKGKLLVEHKSRGKDLDKAYTQALDYFPGLSDEELPRYVLVSDFERFVLHDLDTQNDERFHLNELPDQIHLFDFIAGYEDSPATHEEYALNFKATEQLGQLHDALADSGYDGHPLEVFLVRALFCLFAEDTGIFSHHQFVHYLLNRTAADGSDTAMHLNALFQVLDTPDKKRSKHLSEELAAFPYVNGNLFAERLDMPSFDADMRDQLIASAWFDWSSISPAIFGSLFQHIMGDSKKRRQLGAHYTSEKHILRLIKPLFLEDLQDEFQHLQGLKRNKQKRLIQFQEKLSALHFFDPACGCGNFLIITYRELRRLELHVLREQYGDKPKAHLALSIEPLINLNHFHGIELEEWPARIAEVAMWLTQHQMNREFAQQFGREPDLLPLKTAAHITHGNALQLDWETLLKDSHALKALYILGNPPFIGKNYRSKQQNTDMAQVFSNVKNHKSLDFVTCWFRRAADFIQNTTVKVAFVSTNSICQGEQVAPLWNSLLDKGLYIHFAHRTFAWSSEARGKAAVHVVIIGFAASKANKPRLFEYTDIKGEPEEIQAENINSYLVDAPNAIIENRSKPLCNVPPLTYGNKPVDGGNLLLSPSEKSELLEKEPAAEIWLKPVLGSEEFINNKERWCLWLVGITPKQLRSMPVVMKRIEKVKKMRLNSVDTGANKLAERPTEFRDTKNPKTYILVPRVSSERREYVPMGFFDSNTISTDLNNMIPDAGLYEFGILESKLHMLWLRTVGGHLKSDFRYSAKLVYNNYPWPESPTDKQQQAVEKAAQAVLDAREHYPDSSLADLYDPLTMPADVRKAHNALDKAVEKCYRKEKFSSDEARLSFLFERYQTLIDAQGHA